MRHAQIPDVRETLKCALIDMGKMYLTENSIYPTKTLAQHALATMEHVKGVEWSHVKSHIARTLYGHVTPAVATHVLKHMFQTLQVS